MVLPVMTTTKMLSLSGRTTRHNIFLKDVGGSTSFFHVQRGLAVQPRRTRIDLDHTDMQAMSDGALTCTDARRILVKIHPVWPLSAFHLPLIETEVVKDRIERGSPLFAELWPYFLLPQCSRPSQLSWRPSQLGCRPSLLGWRSSLLGSLCYKVGGHC